MDAADGGDDAAALAAKAKRGAHSVGRSLLGRLFVLLGQVLLAAALLMLALVLWTLSGQLEVDEPIVSVLILLVPTVVVAVPAVLLLWVGRPAGRLRAIPEPD